MRHWVLADRDQRCGYGWCEIKAGTPMQVITGAGQPRVRCEVHAEGVVDFSEIAASHANAKRDDDEWSPLRRLVQDRRRVFDAKARQAGDE